MKIFTTILILQMSAICYSQDFASPGSVWTYSDHESGGFTSYPRGIFSIADTAIGGQPAHIVIGDCNCGGGQTNYLYGQNRRVYFYNYETSSFSILYDFNLNAGQQYTVYPQSAVADSFTVLIDSTGLDTINGLLRKTQFVSVQQPGSTFTFDGKVIEGIGSTHCLYPQYAACAPQTNGLRCYEDSVMGLYDTHLAPSCDSVYVTNIGIDEPEMTLTAIVAPNPFSDFTTIVFGASIQSGILSVADLSGRIVCSQSIDASTIDFRKGNLESGIYFYHVHCTHGIASGKLIIN